MRGTWLIRSVWAAVAFAASVGAGCDQFKTPLDSSGDAPRCIAEMGPSGVCKRCYDQNGLQLYTDCPSPAPTPPGMSCRESTDLDGRVCKMCADATGKVISSDCDTDAPGMMCVKIEDGGPTSCKNPELWKQYGTDACAQRNMLLMNVVGGAVCSAGYQNVTYVCCSSTPSGSAGAGGSTGTGGSTGAGGTGGSATCTKIDEGGPGSCKPYDVWKQYAYDQCQQQNLLLTGLTPGPVCEGGYESMTFTCCGGTVMPTPSPPPPKCGQTTDASGQICKTCWDSGTGQVISNECVPGSTGTGGSSGGGSMCISIEDGGPTSCKDPATWKRYGTDRCSQQNLQLTDVKVVVECTGGYSVVSYVCCGAPPLAD